MEILEISSLLHDIGRKKEIIEGVVHAAEGARIAKRLLEKMGAEKEFIKQVCHCIETHSLETGKKEELLKQKYFLMLTNWMLWVQ